MKEAQIGQLNIVNRQGESYLTITWHRHYTLAKWHNHIVADDVIKGAKAFLDFIREHPCPKLLNDKSEATGDWLEANDWLEFEWLPAVYKAGLRCMAHVYSHSMFSQLSARDLRGRVAPPLHMKNFLDFRTAEKWVLSCNP
ncbi:hypothetical protein KB205_01165 [Microvirga sp. STS03]|uniref:hypothetical protein n=1 Tax=Pontibacter TaxID=323449 RepID=UPI001B82F753|nr:MULTISPECIES: hypothetical protein [Pontibacter]MBR0569203.1 hypothetical protein [Microvirga sp. STS03]